VGKAKDSEESKNRALSAKEQLRKGRGKTPKEGATPEGARKIAKRIEGSFKNPHPPKDDKK
jgi:hypothetical protein